MIELALAFSLHLGFKDDYNSIHPHIRYNEQNYIAGAYYNSLNNISLYAGKRFELNDFGLEGGAVTGYPENTFVPYIRGTYKDFFIGPAREGNRTGIVLGYELKW